MMPDSFLVVGLMAIKKTALSTLCLPLLLCTFIFSLYLREKHFDVALNLPTRLVSAPEDNVTTK